MKRPPDPIIAAVEQTGRFVEVAFLPFDLSDADVRPAWAERGKKRRQWESLNEIERRVVLRLLGIKMPRQLLRKVCPATAAEARKHQGSCFKKLGLASGGELIELHREYRLKFERHAWAARGAELT